MTARLLLVAWALAAGGCVSAGARAYSAGQAAQRAGDLDAAFDHYAEAHRSDPSDPSYRSAFESTQASLLAQLTARGEAREQAEEWTLAATEWRRAPEGAAPRSHKAGRPAQKALKKE
ncbi:MAG: hypothetical protein RL846_38260, partial [Deltaproteobacteria bacterium]